MTKLMTSTALIAMLAGPVLAQTATDPAATAPATTEAPMTTETMPAGDAAAMPAGDAAATTAAPMGTDAGFGFMSDPTDMSAETFIGKNLYVAEADVDMNATYTEVDADWDDIGDISDIVLSADGQIKGVLIDIGGFLGLGAKTVAVSMDQLRVIRDGDSENEYFIVFTSNREALEAAPEYEWAERG